MALKLDIHSARGDGFDYDLTEEQLEEIRADLKDIKNRLDEDFDLFGNMQDIRRCTWEGQSPDGRKRKAVLGKDPEPFEGASDCRIPLVDTIIDEHVVEYVTAATRAVPLIKGRERDDAVKARKIATLIQYIRKNVWGRNYRRQIEIAGNYMEGDSPAGCLMHVYWYRERAIRYERIAAYDLITLLSERLGEALQNEEVLEDVFDVVENPEREEDLKELIRLIHPQLKESRLSTIVRSFYSEGEAAFPVPYWRFNEPRIEALRFNVNVFVPSNVKEIQRSRIYVTKYYTKAEVLERASTEEWDSEFVKELVGDNLEEQGAVGKSSLCQDYTDSTNALKGLYEVIYLWKYSTNSDGIPGIYRIPFSSFCTKCARKAELIRDKHGMLPFVDFMREHLSENALDSRSVASLAGTQQNSLKLISDSYEDHVQKTINPPLLASKGAPKYRYQIAPHGQLEVTGRTPPEYLKGPDYPRSADEHINNVQGTVADRFKRGGDNRIDPALVIMARQSRVDNFLESMADVWKMVIQNCMQYMDDEEIKRITGANGISISGSVEEIKGVYDIEISYDVRDMDIEYVTAKAKVAKDLIIPMDSQSTIKQYVIAQRILHSLDANWCDESVEDVEVADEREKREALAEFGQMLNGIEPPLRESGVNAQLRMQVIQQEISKRTSQPEMFTPISPAANAIIMNWFKNLTFINSQQQNAVTGRFGTNPVFSGGEA